MTVGELLTRASARELAEWKAYFRVDQRRQAQRALAAKAERNMHNAKADLKKKKG